MSDRERIEYLAAMVASGAADEAEQAELDALIESDPEAAAIYAEMEEAMAEVSLSEVMEAPAANLSRIRDQLRTDRASDAPKPTKAAPSGGLADVISLATRRKLRTMAVVTTVSVAAAAGFAVLWQNERTGAEVDRGKVADNTRRLEDRLAQATRASQALAQDLSKAEGELDSARQRLGLVRGADVQLATLKRDDGSGAKIFMDPDGRKWLVYAHQLPDPGPDKDYQLWFVPKKGGGPIPAGLMQVSNGVLEAQIQVPGEVPEIGQAAISLEPKGGSKTPTDVQMIGPI